MSSITENPAPSAEPTDQPAGAAHAPVITPGQAIDKCQTAYQRAYSAAAAKGEHISTCRRDASHAFALAMPSTGSLAEVQALIACVIRGMLLDVWICHQAKGLLSAARIAVSALKSDSAKKKIVG